jgi:hypothetical protein
MPDFAEKFPDASPLCLPAFFVPNKNNGLGRFGFDESWPVLCFLFFE